MNEDERKREKFPERGIFFRIHEGWAKGGRKVVEAKRCELKITLPSTLGCVFPNSIGSFDAKNMRLKATA
jgi:hypothetical protein